MEDSATYHDDYCQHNIEARAFHVSSCDVEVSVYAGIDVRVVGFPIVSDCTDYQPSDVRGQ